MESFPIDLAEIWIAKIKGKRRMRADRRTRTSLAVLYSFNLPGFVPSPAPARSSAAHLRPKQVLRA